MRNNVKVFKVCELSGGKFFSATAGFARRVRYEVGKRSRPLQNENNFLFVFANVVSAQKFIGYSYQRFKIFECRAHNVRHSANTQSGIKVNSGMFPTGTRFCSSLDVVKRLD